MKFYLTIDCDNAAFEGDQLPVEVSRILRRVSNQVREFTQSAEVGDWRRPVRDINGNTCGSYEFISKDGEARWRVVGHQYRLRRPMKR